MIGILLTTSQMIFGIWGSTKKHINSAPLRDFQWLPVMVNSQEVALRGKTKLGDHESLVSGECLEKRSDAMKKIRRINKRHAFYLQIMTQGLLKTKTQPPETSPQILVLVPLKIFHRRSSLAETSA